MDAIGSNWLDWGRADVRWDGSTFSLLIPTGLSGWPVVWLDRYLGQRLTEIPGLNGGEGATVTPATLHEPGDPGKGVQSWGEVKLSGLTPPWPDAVALQDHFEAAVREALEVSEKAAAEGDWFTARLIARRPAAHG